MKFYVFKQYTKRCSNDTERHDLFNKVKRLCEEVIENLGTVKRTYEFSENMGVNGRLFSNGIQGTMREIRGFLMGDHTTDLDQVNAHPKILRYICKKHNIPCSGLEYYINNRDEILNSFDDLNRDDAKCIFLKSLNSDKNNKNIKNEAFRKFDNEMRKIQMAVIQKAEYKDIISTVPDDKKYNINGSKINRILCFYENEILQVAIKTLQDKGVEIATLMFDGCMIYGNHYNNTELLDEITKAVNSKFDGLNMNWSYKQQDSSIKIPDDWKPSFSLNKDKKKEVDYDAKEQTTLLVKEYLPIEFLTRTEGTIQFIKKYHPNKFMWVNGILFCWTGIKWEKNSHEMTRFIMVDACIILEKVLETAKEKLDTNSEIQRNALDSISKQIDEAKFYFKDGNYVTNVIKTSIAFFSRDDIVFDDKPFLLGFNNGVFDLQKLCEKDGNSKFLYKQQDCFRPYEYDDYITISTGYNFEIFDDKSNSIIKDDLIKFFDDIMPNKEHQLLLLQILSSGLDGILYQRFFMLNGGGGNGKGSIFELIALVLGKYYKQGKNAVVNEITKANGASEDIMDLKNKRFILFEELEELDNDEIKRLTGGGETTGSRKYGSNETFKIQGTIIASFNEKARLKKKPTGNSELRRFIDLFFCRNFTHEKGKVGKKETKNKMEIEWCEANDKYQTQEWRETVKCGFLHLLLNVYRTYCDGSKGIQFTIPDDVMRRTEDFLDAQNIFSSIFNDTFENIYDFDKVIKVKDIWDTMIYHDDYKVLNSREKKKYNRKYFDEWLEGKVGSACFDVDRKQVKIIRGFIDSRFIVETDDGVENDDETDIIH
jgi:hypothetical protein